MILRKATLSELPVVWTILQQAIEQRGNEGSKQWQNGYPNRQTIHDDIIAGCGYVLIENDEVIAYAAVIIGVEPAYENIVGKWLTNNDYTVVHRVATSNTVKGKGVATALFRMIENLAIDQNIRSVKVDTNFDNIPMIKILDKLHYSYCGEVFYDESPRRAYEKVL